jgi:DNA-binding phage protein
MFQEGDPALIAAALGDVARARGMTLYRPEQAMDGWSKVFSFFGKHLAS